MEKNSELNELIYEYYESRILFGIYKYGEELKSVPQICAAFKLARNTVQIAFDRLEEKGYIRTEKRRVARVIYQGTDELYKKNLVEYFALRRDGILDVQFNGNLLFSSIWEKGLQNLRMNAYDHTNGLNCARIAESEPIQLYIDVLNTFGNELLLGLFWQNMRYISYFYPPRNDRKTNYITEDLLSVEKANQLKQETDIYYFNIYKEIMRFIETDCKNFCLNQEQIPFRWIIYRKRPQLRYTLASIIIREVLWEVYPEGSYLPSLPKMAEKYQVSLITIRRTLEVLNSLGITKAEMGVGIKVHLQAVDNNMMDRQEIRENLRLYGEALQILALTVKNVTHYTLDNVKTERRYTFLKSLRGLSGKNNSLLDIDLLLDFIISECPSASIREIYGKLRELIAWGYIFSAVETESEEVKVNMNDFICDLEKALQTNNSELFAAQWQSLIEKKLDFYHRKNLFWKTHQDLPK